MDVHAAKSQHTSRSTSAPSGKLTELTALSQLFILNTGKGEAGYFCSCDYFRWIRHLPTKQGPPANVVCSKKLPSEAYRLRLELWRDIHQLLMSALQF